MYINYDPTIIFEKEEEQIIDDLENLAIALDDGLCSKIDCENCPCLAKCNELFLKRPLTEIYKVINFFRNIPHGEG